MRFSDLLCAVKEDAAYIACINNTEDGPSNGAIFRYVREAICFINQLAAAELSQSKKIKLCEGSLHTVSGCEKIISVEGQTDKEGHLLEPLPTLTEDEQRVAARFKRAGYGKQCVTPRCVDGTFRLTSIDIISNGTQIVVQPGVPKCTDVYLIVQCQTGLTVPQEGKDFEVPCRWEAAVMQWVLFRVTFPRADDQYTFPRANTHARLFAEMVGVSIEALEKLNESIESSDDS